LVQALYVPVSDGVRIAVDVWLPVERIARGERIGAAVRGTRYHRAGAPSGPSPSDDTNYALGRLWTDAGFALVLIDARGTGASFGTRTIELGSREISDYSEIVDWVAGQPWSNGRVGVFGTSYEGQAAELLAGSGNPHIVALAALFSPLDAYRELFYPGGCATSGRFARWMSGSRVLDGVDGAVEELAAVNEVSPSELPVAWVKPVDGPAGPALLEAAISEHQGNVDVRTLLAQAPFSSDQLPGLDWQQTAPAAARTAIEATGVPMLIRAGWLDGAFVAGALRRFATFANHQEVEIGPWGHGGGTFADPLRPDGALADSLLPSEQDRGLVSFFARYVERGEAPSGKRRLTFGTFGTDSWQTVDDWPVEGAGVRRWYLNGPNDSGSNDSGSLAPSAGPSETVRHVVSDAESSGPVNRWLAVDLGGGAAYPDRVSADQALLTFTSAPLDSDLRVVGFPVVTLRLATSGSDGAVYVYLESISPAGEVAYVTEGSLRFVHRAVDGPVDPAGLGVPRSFARSSALAVEPGREMDLVVELLPVAALVPAGHRVRVAVAGHDASCFERYGPADETFTVWLGGPSTLEIPHVS
jgi:uncharacterized protein